MTGLWLPAHSADFLSVVAHASIDTLAMATLGVALALLPALPVALWLARPQQRTVSGALIRWVLGKSMLVLRSVPEIVWALLWVHACGLGATAGVLALAIVYTSMLAKVFSEILESCDPAPARALRLAGSPAVRAFFYGTFPQVRSECLSYLIYRWECAVRTSAVLGFVGAGGLGQQFSLSLRMLALDEVATLLLVFAALIAITEAGSRALRTTLVRPGGNARVAFLLVAAGSLAWHTVVLDWQAVFSPAGRAAMAGYAAGFIPPDLQGALLHKVMLGLWDTAWMSAGSILLAAIIAIPLSLPAAGRMGPLMRSVTRTALNALRTLPELVWAALLVLWVGLGPVAGLLALAAYTSGVLGRLFADALENQSRAAEEALCMAGAGAVPAFLWGALPGLWPQWLAYALYRWEHAIRMASVMGFVGAGGLGQLLYVHLGLFQERAATTVMLAMMVLVWVADALSRRLRPVAGGYA